MFNNLTHGKRHGLKNDNSQHLEKPAGMRIFGTKLSLHGKTNSMAIITSTR